MPPPPPNPGETQQAYRARIDAEQREQQARWFRERQAGNLERADVIFIARDTPWSPPYRPQWRSGRLLPPKLIPFSYPMPTYFKPIAWFRGGKATGLFKVTGGNTSCGPYSLGDTTFSQTGQLFVFFAHKGPLNDKTLIDAIAVDKINDPALMDFVAPYRGKSPAAK